MTEKPELDVEAAHKHFSAACYNQAWELLDKADRSAEEDEQMLRLSVASHWHWTQRKDYTATSASVAYWQTSRIYAVLGQAENARRYARLCLTASKEEGVESFYLGYAHEALARAEQLAGNREEMAAHLDEARRIADQVADPDAKKWLLDDLDGIG